MIPGLYYFPFIVKVADCNLYIFEAWAKDSIHRHDNTPTDTTRGYSSAPEIDAQTSARIHHRRGSVTRLGIYTGFHYTTIIVLDHLVCSNIWNVQANTKLQITYPFMKQSCLPTVDKYSTFAEGCDTR